MRELSFTNNSVEARLVNGSHVEHCVYSIRQDERFTCAAFGVAVLPPQRWVNQSRLSIDSAAFAHIDWRAASSADDTSATLTIDYVFVPSTDEPIPSFAHVWRNADASE